jgi:hypothetical protein
MARASDVAFDVGLAEFGMALIKCFLQKLSAGHLMIMDDPEVSTCIVSETLHSYADSYNEVSVAAANRKFGHDVFKECAEVASCKQELGPSTGLRY